MDKVFGDSSAHLAWADPLMPRNLWGQILVAVSTLLIFRIIHEKN